MTKTKEVTFETVEELRERQNQLRGDLEEERAIVGKLEARLDEAYTEGAPGSDTEGLASDVATAQAKVEAMERSLERLEKAEEIMTREACRGAAEEAIGSARKRVGGIAGRFPQDVERAEKLLDELAAVLKRLSGARDRGLWHVTDAESLAAEFGLEVDVQDFKLLDMEAEARVAKLRERLASLAETPEHPKAYLQGIEVRPAAKAGRARGALRWWGDEGQAAPLFECMGVPLHESKDPHEIERAVRKAKKNAANEEAIQALMDFLEPRVATGKVLIAEAHDHAKAVAEDSPAIGGAPGQLRLDKALVMAAERMELVRAKDGSRNHYWVPAESDLDGLIPCEAFE